MCRDGDGPAVLAPVANDDAGTASRAPGFRSRKGAGSETFGA